METEVVNKNNVSVAVIHSDEHLITDVQSALDLIMSVKYETGCTNIALNKSAIVDDFFYFKYLYGGRNIAEIH